MKKAEMDCRDCNFYIQQCTEGAACLLDNCVFEQGRLMLDALEAARHLIRQIDTVEFKTDCSCAEVEALLGAAIRLEKMRRKLAGKGKRGKR